jgi:Ca2+-transporting ATPase
MVVLLGLVLYLPVLRVLFRFSTLHHIDLAICLAVGIVSVLWFEGLKRRRRPDKTRSDRLRLQVHE